jgi:hypothetical protein
MRGRCSDPFDRAQFQTSRMTTPIVAKSIGEKIIQGH